MFQTYLWNSTAAQVFVSREIPHVIYHESDSGAALLPLSANGHLSFMGESLFDYRDVLAQGDRENLRAAWHAAGNLNLPLSTGALRTDTDLERWQGFELNDFYGAPKVSSTVITADAFARDHDRLGRFFRRFQRNGIEMRCRSGACTELITLIYRQKGRQPAETGDSLFSDPLRQQFMVEICRRLDKACEVFTLESSGTVIAALVTFRDQNIRRFYTIYFDQAWAKQSPGMVLVFEVTRRSLEEGLECDYMTGEHGYKTRLATSVVRMHWVTAPAVTLASMGRHYEPVAI